jgi:hypothetical protein
MSQLKDAYRQNQADQAEQSRKLMALGQGLQDAGAALAADTPPPPPMEPMQPLQPPQQPIVIQQQQQIPNPPLVRPQVTCNTQRMGSTLQTVCR